MEARRRSEEFQSVLVWDIYGIHPDLFRGYIGAHRQYANLAQMQRQPEHPSHESEKSEKSSFDVRAMVRQFTMKYWNTWLTWNSPAQYKMVVVWTMWSMWSIVQSDVGWLPAASLLKQQQATYQGSILINMCTDLIVRVYEKRLTMRAKNNGSFPCWQNLLLPLLKNRIQVTILWLVQPNIQPMIRDVDLLISQEDPNSLVQENPESM